MKTSKRVLSMLLMAAVVLSFVVCSHAAETDKSPSDLVVYGKIFTSEGNGDRGSIRCEGRKVCLRRRQERCRIIR